MENNLRVLHIDIAKGISIFLVALYHSKLSSYFPEATHAMSLFRMPLFFLLSGVFFSWSVSNRTFFMKKSEALLKPYFFILLSIFSLYVLFPNLGSNRFEPVYGLSEFQGILYGNVNTIRWLPLWFLTHLFAVYTLCFIIFKYFNFNKLPTTIKALCIFSFLAAGAFYNQDYSADIKLSFLGNEALPFTFNVILITSAFFISGRVLRTYLLKFNPSIFAMLITLSLFLIIALFTPAYVRLSVGVYESPILSTVGAFCGIYLVLSLSWLLNKSCYLSYIPLIMGRGSLFILIFHGVIAHRLERVGSKIFPGEESILAIIFTLFSFITCILIPLIIRKVVLRSSILSLVFFPIGDNKLFKKLFKK